MFPYEMVQVIEQQNQQLEMADIVVPVLATNSQEKQEVIGYKLVGKRLTTTQRVVKIEQDMYNKDGKWIPITTGKW